MIVSWLNDGYETITCQQRCTQKRPQGHRGLRRKQHGADVALSADAATTQGDRGGAAAGVENLSLFNKESCWEASYFYGSSIARDYRRVSASGCGLLVVAYW